MQPKADKSECINALVDTFRSILIREDRSEEERSFTLRVLCFSLSVYLHGSPRAAGRAGGIMRCRNADEAHPAYQSISINTAYVQTNTSALHSLRFHFGPALSDKALAYLHGCSCLFVPTGGANLDKTDSVYHGDMCMFVCR